MLRYIIIRVFEHAIHGFPFSEIYALLCRKIINNIDSNVTDPAVLDKAGAPLRGGQLFRKYLLNLCQQEFERQLNQNSTLDVTRRDLGLVQFIGELFKANFMIEKMIYILESAD